MDHMSYSRGPPYLLQSVVAGNMARWTASTSSTREKLPTLSASFRLERRECTSRDPGVTKGFGNLLIKCCNKVTIGFSSGRPTLKCVGCGGLHFM